MLYVYIYKYIHTYIYMYIYVYVPMYYIDIQSCPSHRPQLLAWFPPFLLKATCHGFMTCYDTFFYGFIKASEYVISLQFFVCLS